MNRSRYSLAHHPEARQRALWLIRDYPHIKARLEELDGYGTGGASDGQPRAHDPKSPVEVLAIKRAALSAQLKPIEKAFDEIPEEYRKGLWEAITARRRYPPYATVRTWKKWRQRLLWYTAFYAGFLE
ncbi:MAG: hypothetical protein IJK59_03530 [Firmicutes bacterium]|nr:hypothetical protein [Bacillota bacterium]MBQ6013197.1 hypothetical protein [Bacillota bacterium]MBQ6260301.1 hypothetical protein [Bacillota bacterium]MBR0440859.1 hypothetical protein [Bacillota bacterium]